MEIAFLEQVATLHGVPFFNYLFKYITYLGEFGLVPIILTVILLVFRKTRKAGLVAAFALIFDFIIVNLILKNAVNRPRAWTIVPEFREFYESISLRLPTDSSFPSGHTGAWFAFASAIFMVNKKWSIAAIVVAVLVAFSRIFLCVHYPTDVLAGMLIGIACGVGSFFLSRLIFKKFPKIFVDESTASEESEGSKESED